MADAILHFDVIDDDPHRLRGNQAVIDWLTANGVEAGRCRAFRVLADDTIQATYYRRGPDGKYLVNRRGDEVLTEVHTVPLTVPIPPELDVLREED